MMFTWCVNSRPGADPEGGGGWGSRGHGPFPNRWIIMLHNLFKVGKCIGSMHEGPFFWFFTFAIKRAYEQNFCLWPTIIAYNEIIAPPPPLTKILDPPCSRHIYTSFNLHMNEN